MNNTVRLAIDVESGDYGPPVIIAGVMEAKRTGTIPFEAFLCGDQQSIKAVLSKMPEGKKPDGIFIEHCKDRIRPEDKRAMVWKIREQSSIIRAITLQKTGKVQATISAGDTGILMGAAVFILGREEGVSRPALAAFIPTIKKNPVLLIDAGANLNCRADHLVTFAKLGSEYVKRVMKEEASPTVALLNIGKENIKGTNVIRDAAKILEKKQPGYIGYVEGDQVLTGGADVIVCDGLAGNVLLKACESFFKLVTSVLKDEPGLIEVINSRMAVLNAENYGAVPLLGIKGTVLKAHGGSSSKAIANAVLTAVATARRA